MKKHMFSISLLAAFSLPAFCATFITIGTGGITGTYYPTGGALCRMLNKEKKQTAIRCSVESTGGSVYNVSALKAGELDFVIAQSDTVFQAYNGQGKFRKNPDKNLRAVLGIYPELLAFVTRKDSNIKSLHDMKGKKINLDVLGSGTRMTTEIVMKALAIKTKDLAFKSQESATEGPNLLSEKKIHGYFGVFGHPTANIKDAANSVAIHLVPIKGKAIDALIKKYPYYVKGTILASFYKGLTKDIPSIGVKALLVSSRKLDNKVVYLLTKSILDNFEEFKKLHPAYNTISKKSLLEGLSVPLHRGAKRAFKEAGLL